MSNKKFKRGQILKAVVEEILSTKDLIVSHQGHLIRVHNLGVKHPMLGQTLELVVVKETPLELCQTQSFRQVHEWFG